MDYISYYKNFPMISEIDIAGTFIYDGLKKFYNMGNFRYETDIFHVLYPLSVGIERLQKVLLILLEEIENSDLNKFEKSLITHSHIELHRRIQKKCDLSFNTPQNSFLQLLTKFYKTCRYNRFSLGSDYQKEKEIFIEYLNKSLNIEIEFDDFYVTPNDDRIKKFICKVVGTISKVYYDQISEQASNLNIYTYEIRSGSPAEKIFYQDIERGSLFEQFYNEEIAIKELLVFLSNTKQNSKLYEFIKDIEPLNLDIALIQEHVSNLCKGVTAQSLIDEIEVLYQEDVEDSKDRFEIMNIIGNDRIYFDDESDE